MFDKRSKVEQLLEKQLEEERAARKQDLANLRADHAAALGNLLQTHQGERDTLLKQIERLQDDLDRTRLLLHPNLATAKDTGSSEPPPAIPEEETGTPWMKIQKRAIKAAEEQDRIAKQVHNQAASLAAVKSGS